MVVAEIKTAMEIRFTSSLWLLAGLSWGVFLCCCRPVPSRFLLAEIGIHLFCFLIHGNDGWVRRDLLYPICDFSRCIAKKSFGFIHNGFFSPDVFKSACFNEVVNLLAIFSLFFRCQYHKREYWGYLY